MASEYSGYVNYYIREKQKAAVGNLVFTVDENGSMKIFSLIDKLSAELSVAKDIEQKKMIVNLINRYEIEASIVRIREDISIHSKYNFTLLSYLMHIAPTLDIDIINKKFGKIIKNTLMA